MPPPPAPPPATGRPWVNVHNNKKSVIRLRADSTNPFVDPPGKVTAEDKANGITFTVTNVTVSNDKLRMRIELRGTVTMTVARPAPDDGNLSITLQNGPLVQTVPCDYTDDSAA
jgi:hypothetical protein